MPLKRRNQHVFHRRLYAGELERITLLKRGDDQQEGVVTAYTLYQCMLPGTLVEGRITGASKSWYSGEAVEISVFEGNTTKSLRTTINHPILTPSGWIPACKIKGGDKVVCSCAKIEPRTENNIYHSPTTIEKIFEAFRKLGGTEVCHRPTVLDLHGDGEFLKSDVEIVRSKRGLPIYGNADSLQSRGYARLKRRYFSGSGLGDSSPVFRCLRNTSARFIRRLSPRFSLFNSQPFIFSNLGLATGTQNDVMSFKHIPKDISIQGMNTTEFLEGYSGNVRIDNRLLVQMRTGLEVSGFASFGPASKFDAEFPESISKSIGMDSHLFSDLLRRFPGEVKAGSVLDVKVFHYDGPVYNVETTTGYYTATAQTGNSIFVKNCRRGNVTKSGEAINLDVPAFEYIQWLIPCIELRRIGVNYLNVIDRVVDQFNMFWQPESPETITLAIFDNYYIVPSRRVDPYPNNVLLGIPGVGLPQP